MWPMPRHKKQLSADSFWLIFAGVAVSALGALTYNLLPLFYETAQEFHGLSEQQAGLLGSSFFAGFTLASLKAHTWIRRINWRVSGFSAIAVAALALLATPVAENFLFMALLIALAGAACSVLYGIGTTVLGDTRSPARWYGLKIAGEAGLGALLLWILPGTVTGRWGFAGLVVAIAVVLFVLSPLLGGLPANSAKAPAPDAPPHPDTAIPLSLWLALAAVLLYLFSITMLWTLAEHLAIESGIDAVTAAHVLSMGLLLALAGSLVAILADDRFGLTTPLGFSIVLFLAALLVLGQADSLSAYSVAVGLFTFAFGLGVPYVVAVAAHLDADGRHVVLTVPAIGLGVMFAPATGALLAENATDAATLAVAGFAALTAFLLAVLALRSSNHR